MGFRMSCDMAFRTAALAAVLGVGITLLACGFLDGSSRTDWVLTEEPEGTVLSLHVAIGNSCASLDRIDVDESPRVVNISAYVTTDGSVCDDIQIEDLILKTERHNIELAQPLGDRELLGCDPPGRDYLRSPALEDCRSVAR